ncbi:methane monooxygenase PmoA-like [Paenibacillus taihuensis]|uniref:Methane monooxygenase PmoA-like n=1 Tax=Paenibacillus taihuensis TaxID=1156355 RepID=A0A3D9R161_9BACL|nr:PmoA family protein [Paenibacillus taihuensis]REE67968.1 methane monooxygenase PmoA-like [Paenibacillus taihuensis]
MQPTFLSVESTETCIRIFRGGTSEPIVEQRAEPGERPYIHPVVAPDGGGVLTENAPPHHPWQHGIYVGLNDVNGVGFWEEGLRNKPTDGSFNPLRLQAIIVGPHYAAWEVETEWLDPNGQPMLVETQAWGLHDHGDRYELDLVWSLRAVTALAFGQYAYGGLFLRMPYRDEFGGQAINSEGRIGGEAEGQRARWVACCMPIEGRADQAGIAFLDHPGNAEHPVPWRVDGQLGISPSRCIAGAWQLAEGEVSTSKYRVLVFCGSTDSDVVNASWQSFASL